MKRPRSELEWQVLLHGVLLLAFLASPASANVVSFSTATTYPAGPGAGCPVAADFDEDLALDLAVAGGGEVNVLLGNGDGTFQSPTGISTGGGCSYAADLDDDTHLDLVVTGPTTNVSVLLGNGDGTFGSATPYPASSNATYGYGMAIADLDGDTALDVVAIDQLPKLLHVLLGNGDGSLQAPLTISDVNEQPVFVAAGDLDGDTIPDLVVASRGLEWHLAVMLGDGDGTFQPRVNYGLPVLYPWAVALADLDGDSFLDVVTANDDDLDPGSVSVLLGNGDGTLQSGVNTTVGVEPRSVAVADFDSDGVPDLVVGALGDGQVNVLLGNGDGSVQTPTSFSSISGPSHVIAADFDGDAIPDLAVSRVFATGVNVLLNLTAPPHLPSLGPVGLGALAVLLVGVAMRRLAHARGE